MKAYKVFERMKSGILRSAGDIPQCLKMHYREGVEVHTPKIGKYLFCFGFKEYAEEFIEDNERNNERLGIKGKKYELWEVEVDRLDPIYSLFIAWKLKNEHVKKEFGSLKKFYEAIRKYWEDPDKSNRSSSSTVGACGATQLKLIKKVECSKAL